MEKTQSTDEALEQVQADLVQAEQALDEANVAGLVLTARVLSRTISDLKMRLVALEQAK